ncbi:acetyltransferase (GNAT) family protein [Saccharopolyspora erythraea NRRL 2338]|uniref:Uncharacterized protein n=2 Tax=Saccharopolyspora erythraea TaxID=1836 RepID=A4FIY3_SACEN|nr:GNAT family N-acetyltransferase [Saccharopolyspora erythraea]EQD86158.1 N-acetyltransferase GCN5 [Saccharopolyspora erythraea D]PFG97681.1 acetyltransferase (GNAT) family protein [Saccharopolyspora erythraea NRRL 2338]QRK87834.1 GNAT family N-acetyltransferase [Saccharopolyspora erythraea]CAM04008.1 hypothetical protein SACE_4740 [Saccharopolyspora erythraea NRRL 2338]
MTRLVIRPLVADEGPLFESLPEAGLLGPASPIHTYDVLVAAGEYRPEWTWVALREGAVVARAAWRGGTGLDVPFVLDALDFTDFDAAVQLLRTAPLRTEYTLVLPPDWRDVPAVKEAADARIAAATAAGLRFLVERHRYRWTPDHGLPPRPGRLEFRPESDDEVFLAAFRRVHEGTLDAHARRATDESGLDAAAREDLDLMLGMPSPRSWWRLAFTGDGELAGLSIPGRNQRDPIIGYIGVLPEQRGHGYAYDLLVEATHLLVAEGADRIAAATDTTNRPMAAAFARAGYPVTEHRIDFV